MIRKLFCSMFVMVLAIGFVAADELTGVITKVDGDKVTFQKMTKAKKGVKSEKDGDPVVVTTNKDTKIVAGKFDKDTKKTVDGDEVKDGLKNEIFTTKFDAEKGVRAVITTKGETLVAEKILVVGGKKKAAAE